MTTPTIEQLQTLADRASRGRLTPAEATVLRAGLTSLDAARRAAGGAQTALQAARAQTQRAETERDSARRWAVALEQELAALHEGEEPCPPAAFPATAGQWLWLWNRATPEQRLTAAADAMASAATLARVRGVAADMEHTTGARTWAAALREVLDAPSGAATGPHSAPQGSDGVQGHPSPERPTRARTGARTETEETAR